ncbi:tripartite ATP-independent transporter DctM subunit [Aminobacter lissarensis]|uniref:TRAP transporter large permease protein n=1 Tax=Aminobacter carboxidus TaxID=376165 RepID=A0A8E1WL51_9HYPH|nr:TRAP transporter large permease subunit [Aminobacter lissarensis]MBB6469107.1 tripartite ATP-independent transporter DctM subunit [Aminobacter lissarensis]
MASMSLTTAVVILAALFIGLPVAVALATSGLVLSYLFVDRSMLGIFGQMPWNVVTSTTIVAVPLFVLMGELLARSGISEQMYAAVGRLLNRLPGGLLHTNVVASGVFAAVCGSSVATAATICSVSVPPLRRRGYNESLALGSIAAGGTLGILIPPSVMFIVYGVLVEESIGELYIAGIVPGLLMIVVFMAIIFVMALYRPNIAPRGEIQPLTSKGRWKLLLSVIPTCFLIFLVLGTIYLGVATATEAAAFGVSGALVISGFMRTISIRMISSAILATAATTSMIVFILIGAFSLQFVITYLGLPAALSNWVTGLGLSPLQFIILICVTYFLLGTFMEELSMVVTTIPIILPMLHELHVNLVWFGVIMVIQVQLALISPPVGMNLFVIQSIRTKLPNGPKNMTMGEIFVGVTPFVVGMLIVLALIIMFPELATWHDLK